MLIFLPFQSPLLLFGVVCSSWEPLQVACPLHDHPSSSQARPSPIANRVHLSLSPRIKASPAQAQIQSQNQVGRTTTRCQRHQSKHQLTSHCLPPLLTQKRSNPQVFYPVPLTSKVRRKSWTRKSHNHCVVSKISFQLIRMTLNHQHTRNANWIRLSGFTVSKNTYYEISRYCD